MMLSANVIACMQFLSIRGIGPAKLRRAARLADLHSVGLPQLLQEPRLLGTLLSRAQSAALHNNPSSIDAEVDALLQNDIGAVSWLDPSYPKQLRDHLNESAPPVLYYRGSTDVLCRTGVGFCGSRKASERGITVAKDCASQLAQAGINVVSGYAAGVDMAAHGAALIAGGTTTIVLAEGIAHHRIKKFIRDIWDWSRVCVVSEFSPSKRWSVGNAMQRNQTICGLSNALILIEARDTGGSIAAGRKCLELGLPLYAPVYGGMPDSATGNRLLLDQGAQPLLRNRTSDRASMKALFATVTQNQQRQRAAPSQLHIV